MEGETNDVTVNKALSAIDRCSGALYAYDPIAGHNLVCARNDIRDARCNAYL